MFTFGKAPQDSRACKPRTGSLKWVCSGFGHGLKSRRKHGGQSEGPYRHRRCLADFDSRIRSETHMYFALLTDTWGANTTRSKGRPLASKILVSLRLSGAVMDTAPLRCQDRSQDMSRRHLSARLD